jgi:Mg2+-importing ATPase
MLPKQILLTNLISDFPYILIASDNVDESVLKTAGRWNIRTINRYMLVFGAHSSVFDLITFATLYFVFRADEGSFQTGWFLVSVLTELIILFVIRTRESILKSTPMKGLFWISVASIVFTLVLPYLPFAGYLGFVRLPFKVFSVMCLIVVLYTITAEYLKHWFYRRYG